MKYEVVFQPYSLDAGHVGEAKDPVEITEYPDGLRALIALGRLINANGRPGMYHARNRAYPEQGFLTYTQLYTVCAHSWSGNYIRRQLRKNNALII